MAIKIKDMLKDKGLEVIAVDSSVTVDSAVKKMVERNIGAILVMEEGNFVGMFTERDVLKCWVNKGSYDKILIKEVMSKDLLIIETKDDIDYAMSIMTSKKIRHMPVVENHKIIGLISIRDVVKYHVGNLQSEVHYLKDYILNQ